MTFHSEDKREYLQQRLQKAEEKLFTLDIEKKIVAEAIMVLLEALQEVADG